MSPKLSHFFASLALFLLAPSALPQCNLQFQYSGQYRASILDLFVSDNDLWAATGYGVQLYDRSVDPPRLVASKGLPGVTNIVRAIGSTAFVGSTSGLTILRHAGNQLSFVQAVSVPGTINDLLTGPGTLFAATSNGLLVYDPANTAGTPLTLQTSRPNVTSLAASGSTLFAADGDNTIEVFSIATGASPQKATSITSVLRPTFIEAVGTRLYVSDGVQTEVFVSNGSSYSSLDTLPFPTRSLADLGSNVVAIAGNDRLLRVVDASVTQNYVELFEAELPPSGGTVNRVTSLQVAGGRLYIGGGDIGLTSYDISHFAAPFPLRAYGGGASTSVVTTPGALFVSSAGAGIRELIRQSNGSLTPARPWDTTETSVVQDATSDGFLLTSSGATLTFWTTAPASPTAIVRSTFAAPIKTALFTGTAAALVLLQDGTMWTVDLSAQVPAPLRVASAFGNLAFLAHSSAGNAAAEISSDATTTTVHFWSGDLNAAPVDVRVPGSATSLALSGSNAALFTFRGITVIDFSNSQQTLLSRSNAAIVTALAMSGGKVIAQTENRTVQVWDRGSGTMQSEFAIPSGVNAISALQGSTLVGIATPAGVATIDYGVGSSQPVVTARVAGSNTYYKKAVANAAHLYLFDGRIIDIYNIGSTSAPAWSGSVLAPGTLDIAASATSLYALSNSEVVTEYSAAGVLLRSQPLNEGTDVTPLGITTVSGAPWVAFSRGCTSSSGCEKRTDVLDPLSLVVTSSLSGGVVDVTTNGSRAYAIFDLPSEIRVYDVGDPLHPAQLPTRANDQNAVAIAYAGGTIWALGDKVYAYSEASLTPAGSQLTSQKPSSSAHLLIDSGCATISGRSPSAEQYAVPAWTPQGTAAVPGNVRSMVIASERLIILTDYSIEIWSRTAVPAPLKRRAG